MSSLSPLLGCHGSRRWRKSKKNDLVNLGTTLEKLWAKEENKSKKKMDFGLKKEIFEVERSRSRMEEEERR